MANTLQITAIEDKLYDWVESQIPSGMAIIFEKGNAPRPETPFVSISLITGPVKIGHDEIRHSSGDTYDHVGQRTMGVSIKTYGTTYLQLATDLQASLNLQSVLSALKTEYISVLRSEEISDISTELETGYENRANLDILLGVTTGVSEDIGYVESVEIDPKFNEPDGDVLDPPPFTVTLV